MTDDMETNMEIEGITQRAWHCSCVSRIFKHFTQLLNKTKSLVELNANIAMYTHYSRAPPPPRVKVGVNVYNFNERMKQNYLVMKRE